MSNDTRKCYFEASADSEGPDQTAQAQSDQGLRCPPTESLTIVDITDSGGSGAAAAVAAAAADDDDNLMFYDSFNII